MHLLYTSLIAPQCIHFAAIATIVVTNGSTGDDLTVLTFARWSDDDDGEKWLYLSILGTCEPQPKDGLLRKKEGDFPRRD